MNWQRAGIDKADIEAAMSKFGGLPALDNALGTVPQHMHGPVYRWVLKGLPGGSFLTAVLTNDLRAAVWGADPENKAALVKWVELLPYFPRASFGSAEDVASWRARGGLLGRDLSAVGDAYCHEEEPAE